MPKSKELLVIIAFVFPILILMGMTGINYFYLKTSEERVFSIRGYDPRSLLSGHYLTFSVDYGGDCSSLKQKTKGKTKQKKCPLKAHICLEPEKITGFSHKPNESCSLFIKGKCSCFNSNFSTKNNRYYVPEKQAKKLEKLLMDRENKREVVLSITKKGHVMVKDIHINGTSIKNCIVDQLIVLNFFKNSLKPL
ncbi:MAG: GDYXXLXY domain-containing protein [Oligoflexia bacterium]|nr:GDYXXLXY domain-containing protein [Oligoflexia bacterium]